MTRGDTRQAIWDVLRAASGPMSARAIAGAAGATPHRVGIILCGLSRAGYVRRLGAPGVKGTRWAVAPPAPAAAPRTRRDGSLSRPTVQQRIWNAARVFGSFSIDDICRAATTNENSARIYLSRLSRAGFLAPGNGGWRVRCWTGPLAPRVRQRDDGTWAMDDPNTNKEVTI